MNIILNSNQPQVYLLNVQTDNHSKETLRLTSFDIDKKLYKSRLLSFKSWSYSEKIHPEQLARAGFTYTKTADICRCNWCGLYSNNWKYLVEDLNEHRRHVKENGRQCSYLNMLKTSSTNFFIGKSYTVT